MPEPMVPDPLVPDPRDPREIVEENLRRLLTQSYRPVEPGELFQKRLLITLRDRQSQGLGPANLWSRTPWSLGVAAAAILVAGVLLGLFSGLDTPRVTPVGGDSYQVTRLQAGGESRSSIEIPFVLDAGETVATDHGQLRLDWSDDTRLELGSESRLQLRGGDGRPLLERGQARIAVVSGPPKLFYTPILQVQARGADFQMEIEPMKKTIVGGAAGAAVGAAVIVTILIFNSEPGQDVVVETNGERIEMASGDRGTFSSDGSVQLERAGDKPEGAPPTPDLAENDADAIVPLVGLEGRVQSSVGESLPGALVAFVVQTPEGTASTIARATTDAEGAFELKLPPQTAGDVVVERERYSRRSVPWAPPEEDPSAVEGPTPPNDEPQPLVITLEQETAIAGRVLFPEDAEAPKSYLVAAERYYDMYRRDEPKSKTFPASEGTFYMPVNPGKYRVWAYAPGFFRSAELRVEPTTGQVVECDFTLKPGFRFTGQVFSKRTGRPVESAIVFAPLGHLPGTVNRWFRNEVSSDVRNAQATGESGSFELDDFAPGRHLVRVLHPDYMPNDQIVDLIPGADPPHVEFALEEGSGVKGRALDERRNPYPRSMVLSFAMGLNPAQSNQTIDFCDDAGNYHLRNLVPGNYILVLIKDMESNDPASAKVEMVQVTAGKDTEHDFIEVPVGATLKGRILDTDGQPMSGVQITVSGMDEKSGGWTFKTGGTDGNGDFEILNLELGTYMVGLARTYGQTFANVGEVKLEEPIDYEEDFTFPDFQVDGLIVEGDGREVGEAEIILFRLEEGAEPDQPGDFAGRAVTDEDGKFLIEGLREGHYRALVSANGYRPAFSEVVELAEGIHEEATMKVAIEPGASVEILVKDTDGQPMVGVSVYIYDESNRQVNVGLPPKTGAGGRYSYERLAPGPHRVKVSTGAETTVERAFQAGGEGPARVEITLPRAE